MSRRCGRPLRFGAVILAGAALLATVSAGGANDRPPATPPAPSWTSYANVLTGVEASFPPRWHAAGRDLTPRLIEPREILSLGTGPLPAGGGGNCGRYPAAALHAMRSKDRLITVQRSPGHPGSRWFERLDRWPQTFDLPLAQGFARRNPGRGWTTERSLRHRGDTYWVLVAFGRRPSAPAIDQAERILETIRLRGLTASAPR
jgi:hypothetical protein